jgi:ubiquinone/menaquinone biosynthesis C-methylase UbiE
MSFDRLAPHYRWMEAVLAGGLLQRCRTRWLREVRDAKRALLIGEGNGRMLEACATALPDSQFTVLDQSEAMLDQARSRWDQTGGKQNIIFERADLRDWRADEANFDLVVTNFFLDCFEPEELQRVITNISAAASPQARWLVADFAVPPTGWRRMRARAVLGLAYSFLRLAPNISARDITAPDEALRALGEKRPPNLAEASICQPDLPLRAVEMQLIESKTGFLLVQKQADGPLLGILTLHDILRAQKAATEEGYT